MKLRRWQENEVRTFARVPKRALFCEPRTGKTLAAIHSYMRGGIGQRLLVVSPVSFAASWADQIEDVLGTRADRGFAHATKTVKDSVARWRKNKNMGPRILVLTYGQIWRAPLREELRKWKPESIILDESHRISSPSSNQGRIARLLCWDAQWIRILSGTPTPNNYGDLWGQLVCLDHEGWEKSYGAYVHRYLITEPMYKRIVGVRDEEGILRKLREQASIITRKEVFGPDSWITCEREVALPKSARTLYQKLSKEWLAELSEEARETTIRADHVLRRLMKFQQITSGFVLADDEQAHEVHAAKVEAVQEALSEIFHQGEKVVLFHRFTWEGPRYGAAIPRHVWASSINGETKAEKRMDIAKRFNAVRGPAIVVAQIEAASEALSFCEASHAFFISPTFSLRHDIQARDRIFKPGESRTVTYFRCPKTVDMYIKKVLANKRPIHDTVMTATVAEMLEG